MLISGSDIQWLRDYKLNESRIVEESWRRKELTGYLSVRYSGESPDWNPCLCPASCYSTRTRTWLCRVEPQSTDIIYNRTMKIKLEPSLVDIKALILKRRTELWHPTDYDSKNFMPEFKGRRFSDELTADANDTWGNSGGWTLDPSITRNLRSKF